MEGPVPNLELGNEVLLQYAQRFAKSSDETMKVEDFDSRGYKWNVCGVLNDEPQLPEPSRRVPNYFFHQTIPASLQFNGKELAKSSPVEELSAEPQQQPQDKQLNYSSLPRNKIASPLGQAPKLMPGKMPSAARFSGQQTKNLTLRVPLPGAPQNQKIGQKGMHAAKGKGASKGFCVDGRPHIPADALSAWPGRTPMTGKTSFWDEFCAMQNVSGQGSRRNSTAPSHPIVFDFDGQCPQLCSHCRLPLGDHCYLEQGQGSVHGECMAQFLLQQLQEDEDRRNDKDYLEKKGRREDYDIGWQVERIPRNIGLQPKFKDVIISHGMTCLVLSEDSRSVRLAATIEPSAAVNLEYLSIALQVRRKEGREPLFSLDPVDPRGPNDKVDHKCESQLKRFEPEWLAGTSAGEVLFQADYHLKELSMGEFDQPVVGMKSCFDYSEEEDMNNTWSAREWFMVRKAEVHLSEDGVVIPQVKMGVEAREQVLSHGTLVDAPITRQDHPMVRYAEAFTKNLDLIAERKSVVFHLRELAKASVLAKFLVDAKIEVEESWFNLACEAEEACALEIPQLWNERVHSRIRVRDGELLDPKRLGTQMHGIYGGVQFGLDKFKVDQAQPRKTPQPPSGAISGRRGLLAGGVLARSGIPGSVAAAPLSGALSSMSTVPRMAAPLMSSMSVPSRDVPMAAGLANLAMPAPPRMATPLAGLSALGAPPRGARMPLAGIAGSLGTSVSAHPRGVDLNLNQFSLDTVEQTAEGNWIGVSQSQEAAVSMTGAFWSCIDKEDTSMFEDEDLKLLRNIFNPNLADRRSENEGFAPPDTTIAYINKLRSLVKEEDEVRQKRKDHFFSTLFRFDCPGALFPSSWAPFLEIKGTKTSEHVLSQASSLQARTDYKEEAEEVLKTASPAFQKKTEDGMIFRIYRVGTLEVRSTQPYDSDEVVGAVFSVRSKAETRGNLGAARCAGGREKIQKVTEYVQKLQRGAGELDAKYFNGYRYYVVLESENGSTVLTEQLADGAVTWEENARDLEDRNSLAKVIRSANCQAGITIQDLRMHRVQVLKEVRWAWKQGQSYATSAFAVAVGGVREVIKAAENKALDIKLREAEVRDQD